MIGFLSPLYWLAALAVAVPIILHLIRRRELRRIAFPAVRYLRRAEKRHAKRLRLRQLLLLATRVAIVLLLAAAAAGPLIGRGGAADHRPTALAIVIDDSQSSSQLANGRRLLDEFVERVSLTLDLTTADDRLALISAAAGDQPLIVQGPDAIRAYLSNAQPMAARADLPTAVTRGEAWARSVAEGRAVEIHVLTDLQAASLTSGIETAQLGDGDSDRDEANVLTYVPSKVLETNGAVGELEPEVQPLNAGRETRISVPLDWYGPDRPEDPAVVRVVMEDHVISITEGQFGSVALLRLPPQDSGWVQGYVDIDSRGLAADDRRYFSWNVRPAAAIAMIGDGGSFVTHALAALEGGGRVRVVGPFSAEVWISASGERLDEGLAGRRAMFVLPPTSPLDLPRLNRRLTRAGLPWQYETADVARGASRLVEDVAAAGLSGITIYRSYELVSTGGVGEDSVLLRLETGEPWLVRGSTPEGSLYLLLATPLTPDASDLPVSAGMVPFFDAVIGGWAREGQFLKGNFEGGSTVRLPARATSLIDPDKSTAPIEGGALFAARNAGNYLVLTEDEVAVAFSVNAPVAESDLARGERSTLGAALPDARWRWSSDDDAQAWAGEIFRARRGRLAWRPVVAMLIVFAILEAVLAAAGRRKGAVAPKQAAERATRQAAEAH